MMKKLVVLSFLLIWISLGFSQDIIVLKDASEIEAKVILIGTDEISYKKWNFQDGPTYQMKKKDVFFIKYENGEKDVFNVKNEENVSSNKKDLNQNTCSKNVLFNMYADFGCAFKDVEAGPSFNLTLGARIYDYAFAGLSLGTDALFLTYYYPTFFDAQNYGLMVDLRGFWPVRENWYPFLEFSFGPDFITDYGRHCDLAVMARVRLLAGFEWKRLSVGMGYDCITLSGVSVHMGYAKVGVRIGKLK